jgi:hypothetical protein
MNKMQFRDLTTAESFPLAYGQDLLKKQSEHFVSNALSEGNFESGYKNIPSNFPSSPDNSPLIVNSKPPQLLIGTYLKHHWRPLLIVLIVGGIATYVYLKSKEKKKKKSDGNKIPKNLYYNLPKKSI